MIKHIDCPACGAPITPTDRRCPYCGRYLQHAPPAAPSKPTLAAWTQGISPQGLANGSYDVHEYAALTLPQALHMLGNMPLPPPGTSPDSYCPPALGFGERQISRMQDGRYFLWPEDRSCSLQEAKQVLDQIYSYGESN